MAIVAVRVNGKDYQIACDDGQEGHLQALALDLNERIGQLNYQMGGDPGEVMSLLLAGLMMSDEVIESNKQIERLHAEVRQLTQKVGQTVKAPTGERMAEMERAMVDTLNEITHRIEKIADQVEVR